MDYYRSGYLFTVGAAIFECQLWWRENSPTFPTGILALWGGGGIPVKTSNLEIPTSEYKCMGCSTSVAGTLADGEASSVSNIELLGVNQYCATVTSVSCIT